MVVVSSLRRSFVALFRNPILFVGGAVYAVVVAPQTLLSLVGIPIVPTVLQIVTFFVTPFVLAGLIGAAAEGLDGPTSFQTFVAVGQNRYLPFLLGTIVEFLIRVVLGVFALVVLAVVVAVAIGVTAFGALEGGGTAGAPPGGPEPTTGLLGAIDPVAVAAVAAGVLLVTAVFAVVFLFVQFYPVAIVVEDADVLEAFKTSVSFVRTNLLATVGFSLIIFVAGLLTSLPLVATVALTAFQQLSGGAPPGTSETVAGTLSTPEAMAFGTLSLLFTVVLLPLRQTYATAFFRTLRSA